MKIRVYADAAATTRLSQTALEKALPFLRDSFGNPSSQHSLGVAAKRALEEARGMIAEATGAAADEIFFTSGASETNAWILTTVGQERASAVNTDSKEVDIAPRNIGAKRVVTSTLEHSSIRRSCEALARQGVAVDYLSSGRDGVVSSDALKQILNAKASDINIASIIFANNEIGTIQPIAELGALLRRFGVPFHTDATQAVGHIPLDVSALNVDFLTASAHKFNGPKGVGFLYLRRGVALSPLFFGGEQERGLRAGTENVAGAVATAWALTENVARLETTATLTRRITSEIVELLKTLLSPGAFTVVGDKSKRLPGTLNLVFHGVNSDALVRILDLKGVCASTGSACSSGNAQPSPILLALGFSPEDAKSSVRLSFDRDNSPNDAAVVAETLAFAYHKLIRRKIFAQ